MIKECCVTLLFPIHLCQPFLPRKNRKPPLRLPRWDTVTHNTIIQHMRTQRDSHKSQMQTRLINSQAVYLSFVRLSRQLCIHTLLIKTCSCLMFSQKSQPHIYACTNMCCLLSYIYEHVPCRCVLHENVGTLLGGIKRNSDTN